jgi:hypothetical protein
MPHRIEANTGIRAQSMDSARPAGAIDRSVRLS